MPKVIFNAYDRKIDAFRKWFLGKRKSEDVTQEMLADELCIPQSCVSNKLKRKGQSTQITYKDLLVFFKMTNATDEEILRAMRL